MAQTGSAVAAVSFGAFILILMMPHKAVEPERQTTAAHGISERPGAPAASQSAVPLSGPSLETFRPPAQPSQLVANGYVAIQRAPDSHFYVDAEVNGTTVHFLVDTGATAVVLAAADAQRL
jgi:predicted aspartyl protease